jgi:hypothetical protein
VFFYARMPRDDDPTRDSAPDLRILGDEITLQPRSYVEPQQQDGGKEEALMQHMARFRSEPLQCVILHVCAFPRLEKMPKLMLYATAGSFAKFLSTSLVKDGALMTK